MLEQIINTLETIKVNGGNAITLANCLNALEQVKLMSKDEENYGLILKNIFDALMSVETSGRENLNAMAGTLQAFSQIIADLDSEVEAENEQIVTEEE